MLAVQENKFLCHRSQIIITQYGSASLKKFSDDDKVLDDSK